MIELLWIPITLIAAAAQTARNATQRGLTEQLGVAAASQIRFLFGLPFALLGFSAILWFSNEAIPSLTLPAAIFAAFGAGAQVIAMMVQLEGMRRHSFAVVTAMAKTEPILLAGLSVFMLNENLAPMAWVGVVIATFGVLSLSVDLQRTGEMARDRVALAMGAASGLGFAASAIWMRSALLALPDGSFQAKAGLITVVFLVLQSATLVGYMLLADRQKLKMIAKAWRPSMGAGIFGAIATLGWAGGMALTSAANVRTLALVEVLMAQLAQRQIFRETPKLRESLGMLLIVFGAGLVVYFHH
jgi:drug/metabolite transporter (DMT)-like permease